MIEAENMEGQGAREGEGLEDDGSNRLDPILLPPILIEAENMEEAMEGEDDGNISQYLLDQFLQPPILEVFFDLLPLEDLAKYRLVSKLWKKVSLKTWPSKVTLKFNKEGIVSRRDDGSRHTTSLEEFLDLWEAGDWGSRPFKQFVLHYWTFKAEDVEQQRFLELVGGHVTSLTLMSCSFVERDHFRRIIYQAFKNLQFLKMKNCNVKNVEDDPTKESLAYKDPTFGLHGLKSLNISSGSRDTFDSMMGMLSHFHKIKSLSLSAVDQDYHRNLLQAIRLIRAQDKSKLPLKNFDVEIELRLGQSTSSSMELLKLHVEQLNLPVQRLKIFFEPEKDEDMDWNFSDIIRDILQHHSSTLKYLAFQADDPLRHCKSFPFGFCLEKLEELVIRAPGFSDNLIYLKYTPKLRVLCINDRRLSMAESDSLFSNSSQLEFGDWTLPKLEFLTFTPPLSLCNMRKLMRWMPNVEHLVVGDLDDVKFAMVCNSTWKNLTFLGDVGHELTDAGVIGRENSHGADGDEGTKSVANITKLKNLELFITWSSQLTSASVHDGFLKLCNLQEIWLGQFTELDDEARAALERRDINLKFS